MRRPAIVVIGLLFAAPLFAQESTMKAQPFPLTDVRLLNGPFKHAQDLDHKYLLSLDPDRLLHAFRVTAGLPSSARPYGGWERPDCELRGHSMGHYLTACSLMYASTGDEKLKQRVDAIVTELARCQQALPKQGYSGGYLSAFPESWFDRVDARQRVWAPWYTMHKILAGLLDAYTYCGNQQALETLIKLVDWVKFRVDRLTPEQMQASLQTEFGGMNEVLANLYAVTKDRQHLRIAQAFDHKVIFAPLAAGQDKLDGLHANTQIPKVIGAAREYELTGDTAYRDIATFFWQQVARKRSYVIGGHSDREHFFPLTDFDKHLSPVTAETCNTYNMLKLTRHLFSWQPSADLMDFYERGLFNQILASQRPSNGMMTYFVPLNAGHFKVYSNPESSFWCCTGTGMENHAKYNDTIYFHDGDSLYVNLFIASELNWSQRKLKVRQATQFPHEETTRLVFTIEKPTKLAVKVRVPSWAQPGASIHVNRAPVNVTLVPGSYASVDREWHDGDVLEVKLPMSIRTEELPGDPTHVAILNGPIVYAGALGTEGISDLDPQADEQNHFNAVPIPEVPVLVTDDVAKITQHIKPLVPGAGFRIDTIGKPKDISLIPFYQLHDQRYAVYWKVHTPLQWEAHSAGIAAEQARQRAFQARILDEVHPGNHQSETDHQMQVERSEDGHWSARQWRHSRGGWFSYQLKVLPDAQMTIQCSYWGAETGRRTFDILIDDQLLARQGISGKGRPGFIDVEYPIPPQMTAGKESVRVKFRAIDAQNIAGGLFGCRMLRAAESK